MNTLRTIRFLGSDAELWHQVISRPAVPGEPLFPCLHGQGAGFGAETHLVTMLHLEMRNDMESRGRDLLRCRHVFRLL